MSNGASEFEDLKARVAALTQRVYTLEKQAGIAPSVAAMQAPPAPAPATPSMQGAQAPQPRRPPTAMKKALTPDLESKIGSEWLNRIGIAAVLIGVSYFIKLAFDNNWVGPAGRVSIGLIAGILVIWWSERFRNGGHKIFSYSLKAVGIGTLYLSIWGAFHVYALIPSLAAFAAMLLVTGFTAALAVKQDAEILAAFAITGAFSTPALLSTGQDKGLQLFLYVALLDLATLVLIAMKPWKRLVLGSFVGTLILYAGWYDRFYTDAQLPLAMTFATIFFGIFLAAPLLSKQKLSTQPARANTVSAVLIILSLLNAIVYFIQVFAMLEEYHHRWTAWFAVALAGIYLGVSQQLQGNVQPAPEQKKGSTLPLLHVALAVGFLTIAVPLKLETHWITLGWLVEAGVLLYLGEKADSTLFRFLGFGALVLGLGRLFLIDNFQVTRLIFNYRFLTYVAAIAVLGLIASWQGKSVNHRTFAALAVIGINILFLWAGSLEISDFYLRRGNEITNNFPQNFGLFQNLALARDFTYSAFWMAYGGLLMGLGFWKRSAFLRWQAMILIGITCVKVFVYDVSQLDKGYRVVSLIALGVILLAISYAYQRDWLRLSEKKEASEGAAS
jgi:uncharacterized membrane protein